MRFSSLTFIVTEKCDFECSYCYQKKRNIFLDKSKIKDALDFFSPFLEDVCHIHFYGGEPLLAFDLIKHAVECTLDSNNDGKKSIRYTISTNGNLFSDEILGFLNRHRFLVLLSFDGLAQEKTRQKGSFRRIVSSMKKSLAAPHIELETNSIFTKETIGYLTKSIQFISELGVQNISFDLSLITPWERDHLIRLKKELVDLRRWMLTHFKKTGSIPLNIYKKKTSRGIFVCDAGRNRMDLTPEGILWGCNLFAEYFKSNKRTEESAKYCFGDLQSFIKHHDSIYPEILMNYSSLRLDRFYTQDMSCIDCSDFFSCGACPVDNLSDSSDIRKVSKWRCDIKKLFRESKMLFWEELERQI